MKLFANVLLLVDCGLLLAFCTVSEKKKEKRMITETFENASEEIIKVTRNPQAIKVDACIITFSNEIRQYVLDNYIVELIDNLRRLDIGKCQ